MLNQDIRTAGRRPRHLKKGRILTISHHEQIPLFKRRHSRNGECLRCWIMRSNQITGYAIRTNEAYRGVTVVTMFVRFVEACAGIKDAGSVCWYPDTTRQLNQSTHWQPHPHRHNLGNLHFSLLVQSNPAQTDQTPESLPTRSAVAIGRPRTNVNLCNHRHQNQ